jgi:crossover junction endodeoxyribonuclease RuvC
MTYEYVIGIDPGITGALSVYDLPGKRVCEVHDLPVNEKTTGKGNQLDAAGLCAILEGYMPLHVFIEAQRPRTKQGVTGVFSLGRTIGVIECACAALRLPYTLIEPAVWKRKAGLIKAEKGQSVTRALQLWPHLAEKLTRKKDHGRAEAALIVWHGVQDAVWLQDYAGRLK